MVRSASRKESFKGLQGPMLVSLEKNVSGDSTTSGSTASTGIMSLSVENSPVTQPAHAAGGVQVGQYPSPPVTGSPSFSYSPAGFTQPLPTQVMSGGLVYQVDKSPSSQAGAMMLPPMSMRLGVPNASPPVHPLPSPHPPPPPTEHLYTDRSKDAAKAEEAPEVLAPPPAFADAAKVAEVPSTVKQGEHSHGYPSQSSHSSGAVSSCSSYAQSSSIDSGHVLSDESSSAQHSAQVRLI